MQENEKQTLISDGSEKQPEAKNSMIPNEAEQNIFLSQRFTFSSKDQQQKWLKNCVIVPRT